MKRIAELYGFEKVEDFAQYLISKAREEQLIITAEISSTGFSMSIEPLENRVYLCPHYGKTKESR
ncbi:MAG TPA: hypothetical protein DHV79_01410 [Lachnospiraceae bacterium]|nr:hypothetical protein [Lachnospiraceae bacterium]